MQSTISTISGIVESISTFLINGIYKNPPFSISNKIPVLGHKYFKLAAVVAIHLGLLFQILKMFKPRNTKEMYSIYVVCFWILLITISILVVNPYDEDSIEYMLSKEDIQKLKRMANEIGINTGINTETVKEVYNPVVPKTEGLSETKKEEQNSFVTALFGGIMVISIIGLQIYTFLFPPLG
jgi:hypothetical protein